ncbi:transcription factor Tfb4-domain-containing protein [Panaeolus papilionaceus]|nr:transcription factor Tfb4-domain-containing protein [Panaeolus papilionaceus]
MKRGSWAPSIANGQISHGQQRRYSIVTANAGRPFVTGARDGHSDLAKTGDNKEEINSGNVRQIDNSSSSTRMSCHLSVLIDLDPSQWLNSQIPFNTFISHLLSFLNAFIALDHENSLAVFAALPGKSQMLYSSIDPQQQSVTIDPNSYPPFKLLDSIVTASIQRELDSFDESNLQENTILVGALTKALCYVNRLSLSHPSHAVDPRILILSVSPDLSTSYIPIMNAIFSAQKLKVTIDACQISGPSTVFLQQAAHLTGGAYLYLEKPDAFLQHLIMAFLPPPAIRKILAVPTQDKIDFRAACFCHKNIIDVGFVCSVCLSIFCQPVPVCSTCRTKFPIKTLQRLNASRPLTSTAATPAASSRPSPVSTPQPSQPHARPRPTLDPGFANSPISTTGAHSRQPSASIASAPQNGASLAPTNGSRH